MALDPIVSRRLYQQVAERIKHQIQAGSISAGERLPAEKDLALQLGVSRPIVREALIALEIAGLVEIRTGSGTYIRDRGKLLFPMVDAGPGPFELLHARLLIEGEVAAEAAIRRPSAASGGKCGLSASWRILMSSRPTTPARSTACRS